MVGGQIGLESDAIRVHESHDVLPQMLLNGVKWCRNLKL